MLEEQFVNYNQSLSLKGLGFNEPCFKYQLEGYSPNVKTCRVPGYLELIKNSELNETSVAVPLKQQVFKWFRDKHKIFAEILTDCTTYPKFCFTYTRFIGNPKDLTSEEWGWENNIGDYSLLYKSYEEAETSCIDKLIEIIKEKKS